MTSCRPLFRLCLLAGLASSIAVAGCAGCDPGQQQQSGVCTLDDGSTLQPGDSVDVSCNLCFCSLDAKLDCTERVCDAGPAEGEGEGDEDAGIADAGVDEGPCHDRDGDGFFDCIDPEHPERPDEVDCDDERFHVQPGGYEFPETEEDDNCLDGNSDYVTCGCDPLTIGGATDNFADAFAAGFDLCAGAVTDVQRTGNARQFASLPSYFGIDPRLRVRFDPQTGAPIAIGNDCLVSMSSGDADATSSDDVEFNCGFTDPDPGPHDGAGICDLATVSYTLRVPPNAQGFAFDFMFLSYEWPEFLCLEFNDTFYAVVETAVINEGAPTNAAFDTSNRPITVNVGFFEQPDAWTVPLDATPFGGAFSASQADTCPFPTAQGCNPPSYCNDANANLHENGSGSGWLTTEVPVVPGQQDLLLKFTIHDETDTRYDSLVLIDGFRWLPFTPELRTSKGG